MQEWFSRWRHEDDWCRSRGCAPDSPIISTPDSDMDMDFADDSLGDLEDHAVELAKLATGFDEEENIDAALYYYKVSPPPVIPFSLTCFVFVGDRSV